MTVKTVLDKIARGEDACVCCVGDSVTYGVIHCRPEETYTAKLAAAFAGQYRTCTVLRYDGIYHDDNGNCPLDAYDGPVLVQAGTAGCLTVVRSGVGGDTVARLCNRADDFTVKLPGGMRPDLMTVMAGINDALREDPQKYVTVAEYEVHYRRLLDLLHQRLPETALVLMPPSYNDHGETAQSHLEPYCDCVRRLAKEYALPLIDVHALWMAHLIPGSAHFGQRDWLSESTYDACHPTPIGSEMTARYIFDCLHRI